MLGGGAVAMRDLYMKTGQGFLLVFSITSKASLAELAQLREEIIRIKDDKHVPIVIAGNKSDLEDQRTVQRARAFSISQRWEAPYYESSARTRSEAFFVPIKISPLYYILTRVHAANVDEVFIDLCRQMLRRDSSPDDLRDDDYGAKRDEQGQASKRYKRKKRRDGPRCVIL
jgi:Ras-related protein Rap-1B